MAPRWTIHPPGCSRKVVCHILLLFLLFVLVIDIVDVVVDVVVVVVFLSAA
jgi:hypothetical protein